MSSGGGGPLGFDPDPADGPGREPTSWPPSPGRPPAGPPGGPPPGGRPPADPAPGGPPPRHRLPGAGRPGVLVGIAAVVLLAVVAVSALRAGGGPGQARLAAGDPAPPFAAPLAASDLEGDANVATRDTVGEEAGRVPACEVRGADVLNACALWRARPVALAFFSERSADCVEEVDRLEAAAARHPGIAVAAVAIRGDRGRLRELAAARGWELPVAVDRDGILADLYGVVVCPQIAFVARGGRIAATSAGGSPRAELDRRLAALAP